ncbi:MAG: hypothetical protein ACRDM0_12465 [Thermoleophilaceae bacterium]
MELASFLIVELLEPLLRRLELGVEVRVRGLTPAQEPCGERRLLVLADDAEREQLLARPVQLVRVGLQRSRLLVPVAEAP